MFISQICLSSQESSSEADLCGFVVTMPLGEQCFFKSLREYHTFVESWRDLAKLQPNAIITNGMTYIEYTNSLKGVVDVFVDKYKSQYRIAWAGAEGVYRQESHELDTLLEQQVKE